MTEHYGIASPRILIFNVLTAASYILDIVNGNHYGVCVDIAVTLIGM